MVTAGKFRADFKASDGKNHLASVHGAARRADRQLRSGRARSRQHQRLSGCRHFFPQGGIESITQKGNVAYSDNQPAEKRMQAWANSGRYTPADRMLVLTGSPRVANGGMATTAKYYPDQSCYRRGFGGR